MKPRITLASSWYDCGYRYELWVCTYEGMFKKFLGMGATPRAAYEDCMGPL